MSGAGGFLLYMGMPAAFVDTTDIWMEPRRPRIIVSWAGPHSGFFLGGLASLLILAVPGAFAQGVLYQFAFLTYLTSFMNLNPLLKMDGYYILMDWLEIPRLRERSMAFIGKPLRTKLRKRDRAHPRGADFRRVRRAVRLLDGDRADAGDFHAGRLYPEIRADDPRPDRDRAAGAVRGVPLDAPPPPLDADVTAEEGRSGGVTK